MEKSMKQVEREKIRKKGKVHNIWLKTKEKKKNICACV
jgi:hypothetical protein